MDIFSILNYQGSKKNLLEFIHNNTADMLTPEDTLLDIFSGTCSVGYSFKRTNCIYANDSELYSYIISKALLCSCEFNADNVISMLNSYIAENNNKHRSLYKKLQQQESEYISQDNASSLIEFYFTVPTIWDSLNNNLSINCCYELFTTYYSCSYFGLKQSMEIDSIRYAIEQFKSKEIFFILMASLFYSMKECVFSKDGHMAQPLNLEKNKNKLLLQRKKSIYSYFIEKVKEFSSVNFVRTGINNMTFNMDFESLLTLDEIKDNVSFIYADPPYTDMQYSRYYHLLNVVASYNYPAPTANNGKYTKGLYTEGRFQSKLSSKSNCLQTFSQLIDFSKVYNKNLAISFAYPADTIKQKTDRYVMNIDDIIDGCINRFGNDHVKVSTQDYLHSNNRNSEQKKVIEYLILCNGR